jgi:uncharacterized membrane protein YtjA (UPF0391 family)
MPANRPIRHDIQLLTRSVPLAWRMHVNHGDDGVHAGVERQSTSRRCRRLRYAAIFFVIALVAALFGFGGIAAGAAEIAKVLFVVFVVLFLVSLVWGLLAGRGP